MPPRRIRVNYTPEPENTSEGGSASPDISQHFAEENHQSNVQDAARAVLRAILSKNMKYQIIRREFISQTIAATGLRQQKAGFIDEVLTKVNNDLQAIFGFELVLAPVVNEVDAKKKRKTASNEATTTSSKISKGDRGGMGLISTLEGKLKEVLGKLLTGDVDNQVANGRNTNDSQFYLPKHVQTDTPLSNGELIKAGITALIIGLILTSDNHINETQLAAHLKTFGISDSLNHMIPGLLENLTDFLGELVKRNYLIASSGSYSIGSRTFMEFSPRSVMDFMRGVYGDRFDPDTQRKAVVTIERSHGESLAVNLESTAADDSPPEAGPSPVAETEAS